MSPQFRAHYDLNIMIIYVYFFQLQRFIRGLSLNECESHIRVFFDKRKIMTNIPWGGTHNGYKAINETEKKKWKKECVKFLHAQCFTFQIRNDIWSRFSCNQNHATRHASLCITEFISFNHKFVKSLFFFHWASTLLFLSRGTYYLLMLNSGGSEITHQVTEMAK